MDFTSINDPAGVKALLDQLRSSQAWQETLMTSSIASEAVPAAPISLPPRNLDTQQVLQISASVDDTFSGGSSVASLLSQLQPSPAWSSPTSTSPLASAAPPADNFQIPASSGPAPSIQRKDVRSCTFQQALPHIAALSDDPQFMDSLKQIKEEQNVLEKQLWDERCAIRNRYEEKVRVAKTKANMLASSITKRDADMLQDSYRREVEKFDRERVISAWDGLISRQQAAMESLGVPTMFGSSDLVDIQRQQRIIHVLEGIITGST